MNESQFILPQRINVDKDYRALDQSECTYKLNLRTGLTHGGNSPSNENIMGTIPIDNAYHDAGDVEIGSAPDISNDSIIYFFYNPDATKHKIVRYFPYLSDTVELIAKHKYLNFQLNGKITDIDIIDGLLYWTFKYFNSFINNDFNPPRKLNLEKAKKFMGRYNGPGRRDILYISNSITGHPAIIPQIYYFYSGTSLFSVGDKVVPWVNEGNSYGYRNKPSTGYCTVIQVGMHGGNNYILTDREYTNDCVANCTGYILAYDKDMYFGIDYQVLDLIKHKPLSSPGVSYDTDLTKPTNLIRGLQPQFCYRWMFDDNEKTVVSPISVIVDPTTLERLDGSYDNITVSENRMNVWFDTGPMEVKKVELFYRNGNHGTWQLISEIYKYDENGNCLLTSDIYSVYYFYNDEVKFGTDDLSRPFDLVPQIAAHQRLIEKNRISLLQYTEGYDNIKTDIALSCTQVDPGILGTSITTLDPNILQNIYVCSGPLIAGGYVNFHAGIIDFNNFWEAGYDYTISISIYPHLYTAIYSHPPYPQVYPDAFWGKLIGASVSVSSPSNGTLPQFLDQACAGLRNVINNSCVIAIDSHAYTTIPLYTAFKRINGASLCTPSELAFIIDDTVPVGGGYEASTYLNDIVINIEKFKGRRILPTWKSDEFKKLALGYYDTPGRSGAANIINAGTVYVPSQLTGTVHNLYQNVIGWQINHLPPPSAEEYSWLIAKNASYWLYAEVSEIHRVAATNSISINVNASLISQRINVSSFIVEPYQFQKGDRIRFILQGVGNIFTTPTFVLDMELIGELLPGSDPAVVQQYSKDGLGTYLTDANGNKVQNPLGYGVLVHNFNYESYGITAHNTIVEIYRPLKENEAPVYLEFGPRMKILNPHTANAVHAGSTQNQTLTLPAVGTFSQGDAYLTIRSAGILYPCERPNFSDFYASDSMSVGLPNLEIREMMRKEYISNSRYSEIYIENTLTNGLSTFLAKNYDVLPQKHGSINSAQEVGDLLRIIQDIKCTSIYIGKVGFKQTPGQADVVSVSESVIGTKYFHPEGCGTVFSESVVNSINYTYFYDIYNACECRWANNGVKQIVGKDSETGWDFGMKTYFRQKSAALLASGIENVNVYSTYEKEFENLIITFVDRVNPANNETIMFHEPTNSWIGSFSWIPEGYGTLGNILTGCLNGVIYKHNANAIRNFFYGVQYASILEIVAHGRMSQDGKYPVMIFDGFELHTNSSNWSAPNTGDVSVKVDNTLMQSRIKTIVDREGVKLATFGKDMMTSGVEKLFDLLNGQDLRGEAIKVRLINPDTSEVIVFGINVNMQISE